MVCCLWTLGSNKCLPSSTSSSPLSNHVCAIAYAIAKKALVVLVWQTGRFVAVLGECPRYPSW
jgi:hypothetical protein